MEKDEDKEMQINNPNTPDKMEKDEEKIDAYLLSDRDW